MRDAAGEQFGDNEDFLIGINGSYARREASTRSDIDYFFLGVETDLSSLETKQGASQESLEKVADFERPARHGVIEKPLLVERIGEIGGQPDENVTITRRMLLLLEGECNCNESAFHETRRKILLKYLHDEPGRDKI